MRKKLLAVFYLFYIGIAHSQDSQFNNINNSLIYLNPSFAGSENCLRGQIDYRNQWPNLSGTYQPTFFSIDGFIKPINGGLALSVLNEDFHRGTLNRTGLSISYAQLINLNSVIQLIPSVQFSANRSTLDRGRLNFFDIIDPRYGIFWPSMNSPGNDIPVAKIDYADFSTGLLMRIFDYAEIGASFSNLLEPNISHIGTYYLPVKTNLHGNYKFAIDPRNLVNISVVSTFQNNYNNTRINLIDKHYSGIVIGLGYGFSNLYWTNPGVNNKNYNTLRGFLGYERRRFSIMYSYDQYLLKSAAGSHELSLQVLFKKKKVIKPSSIEDLK